MSNIQVKVYVTKKIRTPPISVVYGSTAVGIEMEIMDYDLPAGSTAEAMASGKFAAEVFKNPCTVVGNTITMYPETGFFAHGGNEFQVVIAVDGKNILSFVMDVYCERNIGEGNDPATPEQVLPLVQRAEAAAQNADTAAKNADASATSAAESLSDAITAKKQAGSAAAQALFAKKACQDSAAAAADAADAAADSAAEIQGAASQIQANADAIQHISIAYDMMATITQAEVRAAQDRIATLEQQINALTAG